MKTHLLAITLIAVLLGVTLSIATRGQYSSRELSKDEFLVQCQRASGIPVVLALPADLKSRAVTPDVDSIELPPNSRTYVVDPYVQSVRPYLQFPGKEQGTPENALWFSGTVQSIKHIVPDAPPAATFVIATGSIHTSGIGQSDTLLRSPISITIDLATLGDKPFESLTAPWYYTAGSLVAKLFINLLLMLFVPTLALSLLSALVNTLPAGKVLGIALARFAVTTLCAATIGYLMVRLTGVQLRAPAISDAQERLPYDAHPIASALEAIIPTNPFSVLTSPEANSGLQIVFMVLVLGSVIATVNDPLRERIGTFLKRCLGLITRGDTNNRRVLMDYATWLTPFGVLAVSYSTTATLDTDAIGPLANVLLAVLLGLAVHSSVLLIYMQFRFGRTFWDDCLKPSLRGLITAFTTASSFAAYPSVVGVPALAAHAKRRAVFDLGTALNKNGTALYISVAAFALLSGDSISLTTTIVLVLTSCLGASAAAGLPFAAVFGLRMVIATAHGNPGIAWAIVAIDPLADRFVTLVNVFANLVCAADADRVATREILTKSPNARGYLRGTPSSAADIAQYWAGLDGTLIRPSPEHVDRMVAAITEHHGKVGKRQLAVCLLGCTPEIRHRLAELDFIASVDVVDLSHAMRQAMGLVHGSKGVATHPTETFVQIDWLRLHKLKSGAFDVVIGVDVLNMLPRPEWSDFMRAISSALREDGCCIQQVVLRGRTEWKQAELRTSAEDLPRRYAQLSADVEGDVISSPEMLAQLVFEMRDPQDVIWCGDVAARIDQIEADLSPGVSNQGIGARLRYCNSTLYLATVPEVRDTLGGAFDSVSDPWFTSNRKPRFLANMAVVIARKPLRRASASSFGLPKEKLYEMQPQRPGLKEAPTL